MTSGTSAPAGRANPARALYGLSPYSDSVRTQTAHFVSYSSANVPERCLMSTYSVRTRGFIRGSIPLSSTIKRLVGRGSGKANGQKPKMYGHADRIDRQGKGSGKLPVLLDCCVLSAYSCPMTTSESTQRDELAREPVNVDEVWESGYHAGYAAAKPRTITTVEEADALPDWSVIRSEQATIWEKVGGGPTGSFWAETLTTGEHPSAHIALPAAVLYEPEVEVGA